MAPRKVAKPDAQHAWPVLGLDVSSVGQSFGSARQLQLTLFPLAEQDDPSLQVAIQPGTAQTELLVNKIEEIKKAPNRSGALNRFIENLPVNSFWTPLITELTGVHASYATRFFFFFQSKIFTPEPVPFIFPIIVNKRLQF